VDIERIPFPSDSSSARAAKSGKHGSAGAHVRGIRLGQQGGKSEKPSVPKCSEGLRKSSKKLEKLFSSFLRGASCPKSPRVAATAALLFMPEAAADVKSDISGPFGSRLNQT
jgi:hypothetical protein